MEPVPFTFEYLAVGMGNTAYGRRAFVDAWVTIGPMRLHAHLDEQGDLLIDSVLHDDVLRVEIAIALRKVALAKIATLWTAKDEADRSWLRSVRPDLAD